MLLVVIEHLLQAVEVKAISDVLLVYLAEELMVFEIAKPTYPTVTLLRAVRIAL